MPLRELRKKLVLDALVRTIGKWEFTYKNIRRGVKLTFDLDA